MDLHPRGSNGPHPLPDGVRTCIGVRPQDAGLSGHQPGQWRAAGRIPHDEEERQGAIEDQIHSVPRVPVHPLLAERGAYGGRRCGVADRVGRCLCLCGFHGASRVRAGEGGGGASPLGALTVGAGAMRGASRVPQRGRCTTCQV